MFTKTGVKNFVIPVRDIRHDAFLNFSEDYLFEGTDRTNDQIFVELPHPLEEPFKVTGKDPVKELLQEKEEYYKLLEVKRRRYKFDKREIYKERFADSEYLYLPQHLLEFYREKDPDSYFNCDYNFYYTGGFLEHIQIDNEDYLIRPDGETHLALSNLQTKSNVMLKYDIPTRIFNIRAVKSSDNYLFLFRGKHNLNIATFSNEEKLKNVWEHKHKIPIVDARLNHKQVGIVDVNFKLTIRNVETGQTLVSYKNENSLKADNFQQLQFLDANTVALSDRFQVKFIDCRTKTIEQVFNPELLECNALCNFEIRGKDFFIASRHYLIKSDLRKLENISCFSHSFSTPPCYMSFATKGEDTFLCLAGQTQDYKVLFTGKSIYSLPYKVPGIKSTVKECVLNNPSMVLRDDLTDRLNYSVAGLKVVNLNNEMYIFWANSLGEIFQQRISDNELDAESPMESLTNWINSLEQTKPVLHLTCVEEMSQARFALNTKPIESNLTKYKKSDTAQKFLQKFGPMYSKKNVTSKLAQDFLALWDRDDDDDEEEETEKLPEVPVHDKVNSWIQTHDFSDDENSLGFLNARIIQAGASSMDTSRTSMIKFSASNSEGGNEHSKKMYCSRQLLRITECMNTSVLDCAVTFTCDKNVCVYGIQVPAQIPMEDDRQPQFVYPELLYAHLLDADGSRLTYTHFTSRVNYRSLIEISFNRPVYIQRNKVYKVGVVLNKIGCYPIGTYPNQSTCNGVVFTFSQGQCGDSVRDGLIRSIIFSIPSSNNNSNNPGVPGDHNKMPNII